MDFYVVGDVAKQISDRFNATITARDVSNVCYSSRVLRNLPIVGGRKLLNPDDIEIVIQELRRAGKITGRGATHVA